MAGWATRRVDQTMESETTALESVWLLLQSPAWARKALRTGQAANFNLNRDIRGEACIFERAFGIGPSALTEAVELQTMRMEILGHERRRR